MSDRSGSGSEMVAGYAAIAVVLALLGVGLAQRIGLRDGLIAAFVVLLAIGLIYGAVAGFRSGRMMMRGEPGYLQREEQPLFFWGCGAFYIAFGLVLLGVVLVMVMGALAG